MARAHGHPFLRLGGAWTATLLWLGGGSLASAQSLQPSDRDADPAGAAASAEQAMFLPTLIAPAGDRASPGVAFLYGGYDGSTESAVTKLIGDAKIVGPLDVRVGLTYTPNQPPPEAEAQPQFGARLRLLEQSAHGLDLATLLLYRMERFTDDEGLVQAVVAGGRHWGRTGLFANVAYGQDPEGDDREAEFAVGLLYRLQAALQLGLESHLRVDLFSDDPKREARQDSDLELTAGPIAQWSAGPIGLMAQVGGHARKVDRMRTGVIALAGVAYAH
jgi:hypothetical protein